MSIQTEWTEASVKEPAEFEVEYADIKVQAIKDPNGDDIKVRVAHELDTDWMEAKFDDWYSDMESDQLRESLELIYPMLKRLVKGKMAGDEKAALMAVIDELETNTGLIRCQ